VAEFKIGTDSFDYLKLDSKYDGLRVPAIKITVEGTDLVNDKYMDISNLVAETSVRESDLCTFSVSNAYDYAGSCFQWTDVLAVGKKIEVQMGYIDKLETVFEGYITKVTCEIQALEAPAIHISCMDSSFLLMKGRKTQLWAKKKHSDIVSDIAGRYNLKTVVTATTTEYETVVQNGQSDYDFLSLLGEVNGCEFFVSGSYLYFRTLNEAKTEVLKLSVGKDLLGFECSMDLASQIGGVTVKGYTVKQESLVGKIDSITKLGSGKSDGTAEIKKINSAETLVEIYAPLLSKEEADTWAKGHLNRVAMTYVSGNGTTLGIPEIRAGRHIGVDGIFKDGAKTFYIINARHEISEDGYRTHFTVEGNAL